MSPPHARTEILIGAAGLARLRAAHVLVAGLGGVGGYAAEALGRVAMGLDILGGRADVGPEGTGDINAGDAVATGDMRAYLDAERGAW